MKYFFHPEAEVELFSAIDYYEKQQQGLGKRFGEEIYTVVDRICQFPEAWGSIDKKTHRCISKNFPYGVLYRIKKDHIRIMAVMHLHRKPGYWKKRFK